MLRFALFCILLASGYSQIADAARIVDAPYRYLEVELKHRTSFNITWQPEVGTTLSLAKRSDDSLTDLVSVNGTQVTLLNGWEERASVVVDDINKTITAVVTLKNPSLKDEGNFTITLLNESQIVLQEVPYQLKTYAKPVGLKLSIKNGQTKYKEGNVAILTCTGNVGRPLGMLRLSRSIMSTSDDFVPYNFVNETTADHNSLPGGTFSINHNFHVNLTGHDHQIYFRCDVISDVPNYSLTSSNAIQLFVTFSGIQMSVTPSSVVLNSGVPGIVTMVCGLTESEKDMAIKQIFDINILRNSTWESTNSPVVIATMSAGGQPELGSITDVTRRNPEVSGQLQTMDPDNSDPAMRRNEAMLELKWNSSHIECKDVGEYHCQIAVKEIDNQVKTWSSQQPAALQATTYPDNLEIKLNGFPVGVDEATVTNPVVYKMGDIVVMSCSASIGSERNQKIDWYQTKSFTTDANDITKFNPTEFDKLDEGIVSDTPTNCQYQRTTTLDYNVTLMDQQRDNNFLFMCKLEYFNSRSQRTTLESRRIFIRARAAGGDGDDNTGEVAKAGGSKAGIIAGSVVGALVVIVLVVLLVYFLWYRKRGDGETCSTNVAAIIGGVIGGLLFIIIVCVVVWLLWFRRGSGGESLRLANKVNPDRTKEEHGPENPNMVTNSTDYAVPHKERRAYENDGLDEPREERSNRRNDYRERDRYRDDRDRSGRANNYDDRDRGGRANYGMDRDNDSDGSPTMTPHVNHMGMDPHGSIGTGV